MNCLQVLIALSIFKDTGTSSWESLNPGNHVPNTLTLQHVVFQISQAIRGGRPL